MSPISLECRPFAGGVLITVAGEIDATNAHDVEAFVDRMRGPGEAVIFDLAGLRFMDSCGLHALLRLRDRMLGQGGAMHLAAVPDVPARILEITGVREVLPVHPGVCEAVAAVLHPEADALGQPA
jgi:anti-sigma B factor antagonist